MYELRDEQKREAQRQEEIRMRTLLQEKMLKGENVL